MKKPILLIMAAGMGSRYGGLKQVDPVDKEGYMILDYSIYDAVQAGIEEVVCIIKKENLEIFEDRIGRKIKDKVKLHYAFQGNDLPEGFAVPEGRVKPFGTAHAVISAKEFVDGPFIVINADDFYGREAFVKMYDFLTTHTEENLHAIVGFELNKTLTENGHVARGICHVDNQHMLADIVERTQIERYDGRTCFTEDGTNYVPLEDDTIVSMNFWGFQKSMMQQYIDYFPSFLVENLSKNPLKCEYFITLVPDRLVKSGKASIQVLRTTQRWFGVTYKEDKQFVMDGIQKMKDEGVYPQKLWE